MASRTHESGLREAQRSRERVQREHTKLERLQGFAVRRDVSEPCEDQRHTRGPAEAVRTRAHRDSIQRVSGLKRRATLLALETQSVVDLLLRTGDPRQARKMTSSFRVRKNACGWAAGVWTTSDASRKACRAPAPAGTGRGQLFVHHSREGFRNSSRRACHNGATSDRLLQRSAGPHSPVQLRNTSERGVSRRLQCCDRDACTVQDTGLPVAQRGAGTQRDTFQTFRFGARPQSLWSRRRGCPPGVVTTRVWFCLDQFVCGVLLCQLGREMARRTVL
jgi:hypothetical protein